MASTTGVGKSKNVWADVTLAVFVMLMVGMMILPLPTALLDMLLATNVALGVLMMLVALFVRSGLEFTAFPTVLLVTTLYRLALNVSSTRLILLQADAGDVIHAFGHFVVRGNYVVGAVVFLILTLIQFLVVAKGSERVAEVGARFTLDAMPGKQMSIDAELRSGAIDQSEARRRRGVLQRESEFYGSMDGAMKFVKGDAIAGIIVTVINILGGLAIGVGMSSMPVVEALQTYGLLTIGDGLVSQIPSLLISTAAGLVVTRVSSEQEDSSLGSDIARQVFGNPKTLRIAAVFFIALAIVPGLPVLPFLALAAVMLVMAYRSMASSGVKASALAFVGVGPGMDGAAPSGLGGPQPSMDEQAPGSWVPWVLPVSVELSSDLADLLTIPPSTGGAAALPSDFPQMDVPVQQLRADLFSELGIQMPQISIRRAPALAPGEYQLWFQETRAAHGQIPTGNSQVAHSQVAHSLVSSPEAASEIIVDHLGVVARRRAKEWVGLEETQAMLDRLEGVYPALVRHVVPKPVPLALLADVLRRLVDERVSIRPFREVLEALAMFAPTEREPVQLTELVRSQLKRQISFRWSQAGVLPVYLLDPEIEQVIRGAIQKTASGSYLALAPDEAQDVVAAIRAAVAKSATAHGSEARVSESDVDSTGELQSAPAQVQPPPPVIVTQSDVRRFVRKLLEVEFPDLVVLGYQELDPEIQVEPLARISI